MSISSLIVYFLNTTLYVFIIFNGYLLGRWQSFTNEREADYRVNTLNNSLAAFYYLGGRRDKT